MNRDPKNPSGPQELKIDFPPETADGRYANLAIVSHAPTEFFIDFIAVTPNMPQARVQSRIVMAPEHAKGLPFALSDAVRKYEDAFGEIRPKVPKGKNGGGGAPSDGGGIPNPFIQGGMA